MVGSQEYHTKAPLCLALSVFVKLKTFVREVGHFLTFNFRRIGPNNFSLSRLGKLI